MSTETAAPATDTPAPPAPPTALAKPKRQSKAALVKMGFDTVQGFEAIQRLVSALAASSVVPATYRGRAGTEGWANCLVAVELATRLDLPPLMVMQNLSLVDGKPGWLGKFLIALINKSGRFSPLSWEHKGAKYDDDYGVRAVATRLADQVKCEGTWITVKMAKAEGWWSKTGRGGEYSKWQSMPDQMFVYRSASFWASQFNPEATLGLPADDDLEDRMEPKPAMVAPPPPASALPPPASQQTVDAAKPAAAPAHEALADHTLEPGHDPFSMEPALQKIQAELQAGHRAAARKLIAELPKDLQKAGSDLYSSFKPETT